VNSAIIVAAGSSRRMGFDKLFAKLAGKPVLAHSVRTFAEHSEIGELIVVCSESNLEDVRALAPESARLVLGGAERHLSVWNGLEALSADSTLVAIHDGARPLIDAETISRCLKTAREKGAAACARRVTETMKRADAEGRVTGSVDRENLWAMETPQCFHVELIRRAYREVLAGHKLVTDEVSAVEALGETIYLVENTRPNLKITYPADLELAARLFVPSV